ncbi:dihydroorotate dehydrogenase-like protein [Thauera sinica]|uniref:Dihydroorotate dehydrogenase-like protein n=1 Tax=Thauera sinica TaxID=2665146 RepID=A0ABW1AL77_9RHOO|nr:dihydroorotate dehydrogenase-like protein [Thauera sp. K11]ATE62102.1 dihydroorotate dehydrogenase [Thauera sp. K11]
MTDLSTRYLGLRLKNPLVPSSTPLSHKIERVLHLEDAGAAAIVLHSLFEEDVRNEERMLDRFLLNPDASGEAAGHLPLRDDYLSKLDAYLETIAVLKARCSMPVVASINGASPSGWVELGREMQNAGADALELNAWYLPGDAEVAGQAIEDDYLALLRKLTSGVTIPVAMKLSPFFSSLPHFVRRVEEAGAAGVSLFNRFFQPDIDLGTLTVVDRAQLSSSADVLLTMRWIAILRGRCSLTLAATGGVHTAADALKMLLAGADVVHMASALLLHGPERLRTVLADMARWLDENEYASVEQLTGAMSQQNVPDPSAFARAAYLHALDSFTPPAGVRY